ncbi:THAP domain containing 9 [Elysia marginata]|uniref:THAP domain containing 9 n=1 Tax=Elysia marginata TaxID=1093978 RepID=A0AAV4ICW1_9GAST|nr:THAP domain containing 9 [Elysia marginata]
MFYDSSSSTSSSTNSSNGSTSISNKISALQQAQLVKQSISALTECGFHVHSVVCDGAYTNQSTAVHLGCHINHEELTTTFEHPDDPSQTVQYLFDAAHLIKVVRNCLADLKILKCNSGKLTKWQYIVELHQLQVKHTLYLGNKLKGKHLDYTRNKMNVRLAAQTLSASVADAIEYCRQDLNLPQFTGSEETCTFLRWFDRMFDLCNSSNCLGKGSKSALNKANFETKSKFVDDACDFVTTLTDCDGKPLVKGKRKTGFIGFIVTMRAVIAVGKRLLFSNNYSFFLTYTLSQDHLETLFSKIRRKGGNNNNPNALQFKWALRALLQRNGVTESHRGNCHSLPEVNNTLFVESSSADATPLPADSSPIPQLPPNSESPDAQLTKMLLNPGVYHDHVFHYIAGFICRRLKEKIVCSDCCAFLSTSNRALADSTLTHEKNRGGLIFVS